MHRWAPRIELHAEILSDEDLHKRFPGGIRISAPHAFSLVLLNDDLDKREEFILSCEKASERERWVEAIVPKAENDDEAIYGEWGWSIEASET